jgi:CCCH-type zinc finger/Zinc finger C-x8-C-x5-C-x3-H type (and similar)
MYFIFDAEIVISLPQAIQSYDAPNASDGGARVSGPICKSFLQGRCRYGDSCWYQHSSAEVRAEKNGTNEFWSPRAAKPTNKSICSFFANGHCKKGTACSFLHSSNDDRGEAGNSHSWTIPTEPWVQEETQEVKPNPCDSYKRHVLMRAHSCRGTSHQNRGTLGVTTKWVLMLF